MLSVAKLSREICVIYSNAFVCLFVSRSLLRNWEPGLRISCYLTLSLDIDYIYYPEPGFFVPHFLLPLDLRERLFSTPPDSYLSLSLSPLYLRLAIIVPFFLIVACLFLSFHLLVEDY